MGLINFGNTIKNRKFEFLPRYYDPDKDELESRLKRYNRTYEDTDLAKQRIQGGFRRRYGSSGEYASKAIRRSNRILLYTLGILLLLTYVLISEYLPFIIAAFE